MADSQKMGIHLSLQGNLLQLDKEKAKDKVAFLHKQMKSTEVFHLWIFNKKLQEEILQEFQNPIQPQKAVQHLQDLQKLVKLSNQKKTLDILILHQEEHHKIEISVVLK